MIGDLPQNNPRVGCHRKELGKLLIVEPGRRSVYEDHHTSSLLLCMFEISYNKFFKRGGRMDENVGECDRRGWAQGVIIPHTLVCICTCSQWKVVLMVSS